MNKSKVKKEVYKLLDAAYFELYDAKNILKGENNELEDYELDLDFLKSLKIELEAEWGGEGDGAAMSKVFKVTDKDKNVILLQANGYYSSWDSSSWEDELVEVVPYQKTVIRYKKV